ncbi:unnamed protein product [Rotaria socialis]|uniref:Uncharacterized protein n=3 Tax=Rotaria socialis TaxID=392032 RepID=A0A818M8X1_9BILA|nr:unnamed protein product [Rotaria socialis]CAF3379625.1 unnamed protein product [Rotaria socialis]CAF3405854.1 unnamed protein product [Rotaria socialis]CAF3450672.1 unnamed protein product [Rotaria socialis]CAF3582492.1 unnamed protein product [Rotaria socialis]
MSMRKVIIICLILTTIIVPLTQLSFGFYYIKSIELCPLQHDIMLLMAIGGIFEAIFFSVAFGFVYSITPAKYKIGEKKENSRISQYLIGAIMCIFGVAATIFFILLQIRVYGNYKKFQWKFPTQSNYCLSIIFYSALGSIIGSYVAIILFSTVTMIFLFGIGV